MEPLNDNELNQLLRRWEAPDAPQSLQPPSAPKASLWQWLWTGRIPVPVPVGVLLFAVVAMLVVVSLKTKPVIPVSPEPLGNSFHTGPASEPSQPDSAPKIAPPPQRQASPEAAPHSESAALAGFRPVIQVEPRVIGVAK